MDPLPTWIDPEAWDGFLAMRVKIKKPMTDRAKRMLLKRLTEMHSKGHDVNACLEQSEFHCWQDVYEVKDKSIQRAESRETPEQYIARQQAEREASKGTAPPAEARAKIAQLVGGAIRRAG